MKNLLLFISFLAIVACADSGEKQKTQSVLEKKIDSLYQVVMDGHDKIMPDMGNIASQKTKLIALRNELLEENPEGNEKAQELRDAIAQLNKAETLMFDWMSDFTSQYDSLSVEDKFSYLLENQILVDNMIELFKTSQEKANQLLNNQPQ
jgi:hypothetical protein